MENTRNGLDREDNKWIGLRIQERFEGDNKEWIGWIIQEMNLIENTRNGSVGEYKKCVSEGVD